MSGITLSELLKKMIELGGSDLHITTNSAPRVRVHGKLKPMDMAPLTAADTKALAYSVLTDAQKHRFEENLELDFSFGLKNLARFRGNVFNQRGAVGAVFRTIPWEIKGFDALGLPLVVKGLCDKPRGLVLVTGPTGSGKSTTLALLHRSFDPQSGRILLDGRDIREITLTSLRRNIGVVFQEPMLFARSIRENLLAGKPEATEEELETAIRRAQAAEFIAWQPEGLDTLIGERGRSLSGGERQRLSIARALLKDPPILILDEATSALDAATEERLQRALDEVMIGRTTFVIAHRLSTIRHATRVLVFDQGRVVETGSFDELIGKGGSFAKLAQAQFATQKH